MLGAQSPAQDFGAPRRRLGLGGAAFGEPSSRPILFTPLPPVWWPVDSGGGGSLTRLLGAGESRSRGRECSRPGGKSQGGPVAAPPRQARHSPLWACLTLTLTLTLALQVFVFPRKGGPPGSSSQGSLLFQAARRTPRHVSELWLQGGEEAFAGAGGGGGLSALALRVSRHQTSGWLERAGHLYGTYAITSPSPSSISGKVTDFWLGL